MDAHTYEQFGIDYDDALDRFAGNIALYRRLAGKYADDDHFVGFEAAMAAEDYEEAYRQAHALKGVAGNLSFTRLYDLMSQVCHALREGAPETAATLIPEAANAHRKAREAALAFREGSI